MPAAPPNAALRAPVAEALVTLILDRREYDDEDGYYDRRASEYYLPPTREYYGRPYAYPGYGGYPRADIYRQSGPPAAIVYERPRFPPPPPPGYYEPPRVYVPPPPGVCAPCPLL